MNESECVRVCVCQRERETEWKERRSFTEQGVLRQTESV